MFSWCLICWMNPFPVRSSGAAAQRTCQREVIEGHAVLHLVPLQLLLVQRRQRSRQIFHRGRRRVWRYEQTQVQMFVQVLNVIINIMNETKRHSANSQWGAAAGAAPPSALLPRLHQQLVHQSVSDRLLRQPLSTGRRHLRRTGDNNVFIKSHLQKRLFLMCVHHNNDESINNWSGGGGEPGGGRGSAGRYLRSVPWRRPLPEQQLRRLLWRAAEGQDLLQVTHTHTDGM